MSGPRRCGSIHPAPYLDRARRDKVKRPMQTTTQNCPIKGGLKLRDRLDHGVTVDQTGTAEIDDVDFKMESKIPALLLSLDESGS